jgi:hypothetical protein
MPEIKSRIFNYGNENECKDISKYGTQEKGRFKYCKATGTCLPIDEARRLDSIQEHEKKTTLASVAHGVINDEMPETRHPADKRHYTSKTKFRETTKAYGLVEIGTAYDNGYDPETDKNSEKFDRDRRTNENFKEKLIWNLNRINN